MHMPQQQSAITRFDGDVGGDVFVCVGVDGRGAVTHNRRGVATGFG